MGKRKKPTQLLKLEQGAGRRAGRAEIMEYYKRRLTTAAGVRGEARHRGIGGHLAANDNTIVQLNLVTTNDGFNFGERPKHRKWHP